LTRNYEDKIRLATTCKKSGEQQDVKINGGFKTNGRKLLGRPLKRLLKQGEIGLSRPSS
jgi:hypothetical protein